MTASNRPTRHVCIATGQNLANLIPCLQLGAREVVILETPAMREAAGNLKCALDLGDILLTQGYRRTSDAGRDLPWHGSRSPRRPHAPHG